MVENLTFRIWRTPGNVDRDTYIENTEKLMTRLTLRTMRDVSTSIEKTEKLMVRLFLEADVRDIV